MNSASITRSDSTAARRVPLWLKLAYTAFLGVLVPVYLVNYGPTNFLYFCDVALLLTLAGMWTENALLVSLPAVGILLPQVFWCIDFGANLAGIRLTGMTDYMFDARRPLFLRGLSLFHGWLPFLVFFLVRRLGYDRRAFSWWTAISAALCVAAYLWLPAAGAVLADPKTPHNVNYVFGLNDAAPQPWLPSALYLCAWIVALTAAVYAPTHVLLRKIGPAARRIPWA